MFETNENLTLNNLTKQDKQKLLFEQQKETLDLFLERRAITKERYDNSLQTLYVKIEKPAFLISQKCRLFNAVYMIHK